MIEKYWLVASLWGLTTLVGGCAGLPVGEPKWPKMAPAQAYFEQVYDEDPRNQLMQTRAEYLDWVRQFYSGSDFYPFGWSDLERSLLAETEAHIRADTAEKLRRLGKRISADWAKDNRVRHITEAMLLIWSQVIQEAAKTGEHSVAIGDVAGDVAALLDQRLQAEAISAERYRRWIPEDPEIL